jgi:hypothetical protein
MFHFVKRTLLSQCLKCKGKVSPEPKLHAVNTDWSNDTSSAFLIIALGGAVVLQFGPFVTNDMTCGAHFIRVCAQI